MFLNRIKHQGLSINKFLNNINLAINNPGEDEIELTEVGERDEERKFYITERNINNNAEDIFISIDRSLGANDGLNDINRVKIYPEEFLTNDGEEYILNGIVYMPFNNHYASVFRCNDIYYNDCRWGKCDYCDINIDNFIYRIGNITDVKSNNIVCNTSSLYHYIKR